MYRKTFEILGYDKHFLHEAVISEKTKAAENLLSIINNVETKAYFLFLKHVLNFFNQFNIYFYKREFMYCIQNANFINIFFLSKLKVSQHFETLCDIDREKSMILLS